MKLNTTLVIDNQELNFTEEGKTRSLNLEPGTYKAIIYENQQVLYTEVVTIDCTNKQYTFIITNNVTAQLNEVIVTSQTTKQKLENTPFSVQVIDLKKEYSKAGDIGTLLNRTTGVKIRTDGNLGATTQVNLGGLQGKAIRIFKDGIPIELFGHGFNIGTIPTNMLERVEVYKGAMPIYLASDALGGGINLVTRNPKQHTIEASYEIGSFNTHRSTVNAFIVGKDPSYYFGVNTAYNYSDNNYKIEAPFIDSSTMQKYTKEVKRFHDKTKSYYGEIYTGIRDKKWADDVRFSFIFSDFYKEIQNDSEMGKVYGEPLSKEKNYGVLLSYKKQLLDNRLKLHYSVNYSHFKTKLIDTASTRYNWDGDIILTNQITGEINRGGSNQHTKYDMFSNRLSVSYDLNDQHIVEFGELFYYQRRKGSDPLGAVSPTHQVDVLTIPAIYQKNITALAIRSKWLNEALESIVGVKYYSGKTEGFTTDKFNFAWSATSANKHWGYLTGIKWSNRNALLKFSYEYATRLPDEMEVFGDGVLIKENLDLLPEKSHNINLETQYAYGNEKNNGTIGATLFYRRVQDAIFLQPDIPYNRYINFHNIAIKGVEFEVNYNRSNRIDFGVNLTYQDIRRINEKEEFKIYEGARVSNIPFLFGNLFFNSHFKQVFSKGDHISLRWNLNYVHRFYLTDIPKNQEPPLFGQATDIISKLVIPNDGRLGQFTHDFGVYYQFAQKKISTSFEVHNIANAKLYDNFNVQKPGRSFHFKIIYKII
ncbi:MAG: TonB-dependent receptor plug domain-containing protein [Flavobacteriaceae bacterium]|jgi:outer membrane receptor protein involved in Fe transport|nr:TonB-dependent receptor plug domain-containing protein [Flavobacteriaceae bacterium]